MYNWTPTFINVLLRNNHPIPRGQYLVTFDPETSEIAKKYWSRSPHGKMIEFKLGPALETLKTIEGPFDLVFIGADKVNYINYWELCLPLIRCGGSLAWKF